MDPWTVKVVLWYGFLTIAVFGALYTQQKIRIYKMAKDKKNPKGKSTPEGEHYPFSPLIELNKIIQPNLRSENLPEIQQKKVSVRADAILSIQDREYGSKFKYVPRPEIGSDRWTLLYDHVYWSELGKTLGTLVTTSTDSFLVRENYDWVKKEIEVRTRG